MAGILVKDHDAAVEWYGRALGRPADTVPMPGYCAEWIIGEGAMIQVVHDPERGGRSSVSLVVPSIDEHIAALREAGIDTPERTTVPGFIHYVTVADPEGNQFTLVESLTGS
ncbi:glyoxalase [Amycolatopsis antarctica]|uniref:Glyoxalase n=2 Tax=Amycolatopsis antarctica TaxID=1854586 RepID=A0A263DA13_9PSEU|nr:glyoxalase [Amycolatopsis antarctica]